MNKFEFDQLASDVEIDLGNISVDRYYLSVRNIEIYRSILGISSNLIVMETNLRGELENKIVAVSSPETEAVGGAGAFVPEPSRRSLRFVIPKMHTGIPSQIDGEVAVSQIIQTETIKESLSSVNPENSGIINIGIEGQQAQLQRAVYLVTGMCLPTTNADIGHRFINDGQAREGYFYSEPRFKDFGDNLELLFICDQVVSGMRIMTMIEKLEQMEKLPKKIVIISPKSTRFGLEMIGKICRDREVQFQAGVGGALMSVEQPLYNIPSYPRQETQVADLELHLLITGMFENKLISSNINSPDFLKICRSLTEQKALDMGILDKLLPYSTRMVLRKWK